MSLVGTIQSLFQDKERTKPIFPVTKVKAVSDDNGTGLEALLEDIHTEIDELTYSDVGAAPAGYGLGENPKVISIWAELDEARAGGFYHYSAAGSTLCGVYFNHASVQVVPFADNNCVQIIRPLNTPYVIQRYYYDGSWSDVEIENPPMIPGVEYLTTEVYDGYPVYIRRVDCGAMPNATIKRVAFTNVWATAISLDCGGKYNGTPIGKGHPYLESWDTEGNVICMRASDDKSAITGCWAIVKYVKI